MKTPLERSRLDLSGYIPARATCLAWLAFCGSNALCAPQHTSLSCTPLTLRGHVDSGTSYTHPITAALDFKLEAVPAGWMIRVLPHGAARPAHDYAELANPPYRSPTPLLISTDFSFRAQDAIAWNPRNFRYFTSARSVQVAELAYEALEKNASSSASASLLGALPDAKEATLTFVDADLSGGTSDQTTAAARVASHFAETAHRIHSDGAVSPLGKLLGLTFQVTFPSAGCQPRLSRR